jgi:predicted transcriptional regulator
MLASLKVRDYMSRINVTFSPEMDVLRAIHILIDKKISGAPVTDDHDNLIGYLSEKDCMQVALKAAYHDEVGGRVDEYMSQEVITFEVDTPIIELAEGFLNTSFRRHSVTDNNQLVGSISRRDVLRALESISSSPVTKKKRFFG